MYTEDGINYARAVAAETTTSVHHARSTTSPSSGGTAGSRAVLFLHSEGKKNTFSHEISPTECKKFGHRM